MRGVSFSTCANLRVWDPLRHFFESFYREASSCPLTSRFHWIQQVYFFFVLFVRGELFSHIRSERLRSGNALCVKKIKKNGGRSGLMPTRQYDRLVFAVRGLLSSPRETPAPFVAQDNLSRCLCSRSSSPLHTFINSGRTELYFHIPLPRRSFFFFFSYLFCNTSPWCINTEGPPFLCCPSQAQPGQGPPSYRWTEAFCFALLSKVCLFVHACCVQSLLFLCSVVE